MRFRLDSSSANSISESIADDNPKHQLHLRSYLDLPYNLEFDATLYFVDKLVYQDVSSYARLDAR